MRDRLKGMATTASRLTAAVGEYLGELRRVRDTGAATEERSYYPALRDMLDAVGGTSWPKVFCVMELGQQGAGHPDLGLEDRVGGRPHPNPLPEGEGICHTPSQRVFNKFGSLSKSGFPEHP